jgi:hypothetical protein
MALKDRLRRFTRSSSRSSTTPTPLQHAPTVPITPLTKTTTRLNLSKTLTFAPKHTKEKSRDKILQVWEKKDKAEWKQPTTRRPGRKSQKHQDVLRAFEWSFGSERKEREGSVWSGVSPCTSRIGSVDDGKMGMGIGRVMSAGSGRGRLGSRGGSTAVERVVEE